MNTSTPREDRGSSSAAWNPHAELVRVLAEAKEEGIDVADAEWAVDELGHRDRRRGIAWGWRTPFGQRFYGLDFGRFAVGVLLDA